MYRRNVKDLMLGGGRNKKRNRKMKIIKSKKSHKIMEYIFRKVLGASSVFSASAPCVDSGEQVVI